MKQIIKYLIFIILMTICDYLDTLEQYFYIGLSIRPFRQLFFVLIIPLYVLFVLAKVDRKFLPSVLFWSFSVWNLTYMFLLPAPIEGGYYWLDPLFVPIMAHFLWSIASFFTGLLFYVWNY